MAREPAHSAPPVKTSGADPAAKTALRRSATPVQFSHLMLTVTLGCSVLNFGSRSLCTHCCTSGPWSLIQTRISVGVLITAGAPRPVVPPAGAPGVPQALPRVAPNPATPTAPAAPVPAAVRTRLPSCSSLVVTERL